jgi:putative membrane protein
MKAHKSAWTTIAITIIAASPAFAIDTHSVQSAKDFVKESIQDNLAEVQVGELARIRGKSEGVRTFGATLIVDHAAANRRAMAVATNVGVTPPTQPSTLQTVGYKTLSILSGSNFDKKLLDDMLKDHKKDIHAYEQHLDSQDPAVAAYAKKILPALKKHLEIAQELRSSMVRDEQ